MNEIESRAASGLIRLPQSFVELNTAGEQSEGQMIHVLRRPSSITIGGSSSSSNDADYMYVRYVQ